MSKEPVETARKSVLIVEDSDDFASLLKYLIEDMGFDGVKFPINETDIVTMVKNLKPSAILMDLALRKKTGMEFIAELKEDSETDKIPITIITGRDLSMKEVLELQVREIGYVRKGRVDMEEMKNAIRESVEKAPPPASAAKPRKKRVPKK